MGRTQSTLPMPRLSIPELTDPERADLSVLPRQELEDLAWLFRELRARWPIAWVRTLRPVRLGRVAASAVSGGQLGGDAGER